MIFRVDKRKYQVGDTIMPKTSFEETMQDEKKEMEDLLNRSRPENVPERKQCLFLFQDLICALRFYSKYGGIIYGVSVKEPPYFRGDMNKLDNILDIFRFSDDNDLRLAAVNEYWKAGTHTFNPSYEILVSSACVEKILSEDISLYKVRDEIRTNGGSVEHTLTHLQVAFRKSLNLNRRWG